MSDDKFIIPDSDGEIFITPPLKDVHKEILNNRGITARWNFSVCGIPVSDFRNMVRRESLAISKRYLNRLNLSFTPPFLSNETDDPYIIQTGHQPEFSHPGVIIKYSLLNSLVNNLGGIGVDLIVDNGVYKNITVDIPSFESPEELPIELTSMPFPTPIECISSPDSNILNLFTAKISERLKNPLFEKIESKFHVWNKAINNSIHHGNIEKVSDYFVLAKRAFFRENNTLYNEIPVSMLADSEAFLHFFLHIVYEAKRFALVYNSKLREYRKRHRLRYSANPFPDLEIVDDTVEIPFWFIQDGKRKSMAVRGYKGKQILVSGKEDILELDSTTSLDPNLMKIRPKAIALTMFNRMFFSDIFIHGIGGAKYDRITDAIIRDFYRVEPPAYISVSLTKMVDVKLTDYKQKIQELEAIIRDIKFNPDRYINDSICSSDIARKKTLLEKIKGDNSDKKKIGMEIKEINDRLRSFVSCYKREMEEKIILLSQKQKVYSQIMKREMPYFLFTPEDIWCEDMWN